MKLIFLVADGMGDYPLEELGNKTPLEAAYTPNLDFLAQNGTVGTCSTVPTSLPVTSDVANMALLGFDPKVYHTSRGSVEAAASDISIDDSDLVWRLNFVTLPNFSPKSRIKDYCYNYIPTRNAHKIIDALKSKLDSTKISFHHGNSYRHTLIHHGKANSPLADIKLSPPQDILNKPITEEIEKLYNFPELYELLKEANTISRSIFPDCGVWIWGQGKKLTLPNFNNLYPLKGGVISAVNLIKGLGRAASMEVLEVSGATGLVDTNYLGKAQAAIDFLSKNNFIFIHLEAPDEAGHQGSIGDKVLAIEKFDKYIIGSLLQKFPLGETHYIATCDHYTPVKLRNHSRDPVPFVYANGIQGKNSQPFFSESIANQTSTHITEGHTLMRWVLNKLNLDEQNYQLSKTRHMGEP